MGATLKATPAEREELIGWVVKAQKGDTSAFEQLVKLTEKKARKVAFSVVGHDLLDDALQESYLLVFRKLKQLREPEAFIGWLSRLVLHVCYKLLKKNPHSKELNQTLEPQHDQTEDALNSLALRQALERLQRKDREVLILREFLELSYEETAYALDLPVGTVRSRLHAARKKLQQRLLM